MNLQMLCSSLRSTISLVLLVQYLLLELFPIRLRSGIYEDHIVRKPLLRHMRAQVLADRLFAELPNKNWLEHHCTGYLAHPFEVSHHKTERQGDKNRLY